VSDWATIFLGVIALASLVTALVQIGVVVSAARLAKRAERLLDVMEQEIRPIIGQLSLIGRDASHAASLAAAQVERVDHVFGMLAERLDETLNTIQRAVTGPAREAAALVAGLRATLNFLREFRVGRARPRADDEDVLFI
jgi:hypothetical protein